MNFCGFNIAFLFFFLLLVRLTNGFTVKAFEIYDLEETTALFSTEAFQWVATGSQTTQLDTVCGTTPLLGGIGVLSPYGEFERTYTSLPVHTGALLTIKFWMLDQRAGSLVSIRASNPDTGVTTFMKSFDVLYNSPTWDGNICGDPTLQDLKDIKVIAQVPHTGDKMKLKLVNSNSNQYFGVRDIKLLFSNETLPMASCSTGNPLNLPPQYLCTCPEGQYFDSVDLHCKKCDRACVNCYSSGPTHCYECQSNYLSNGVQCLPCHSTCGTCFGFSPNQCISCKSGDQLSAGTCKSSEKSTFDSIKQVTGYIASVGIILANTLSIGSSGGVTAAVFPKMIEYIKYLRITYSEELEAVLLTWKTDFLFLKFGPDLPDSVQARFDCEPLPSNFKNYDVHSSFLINFWDSLTSMAIIFISLLCLVILQALIKKAKIHSIIFKVINKLRVITQNFLVGLFYYSMSDVMFFSILDFSSTVFASALLDVSFSAAILCSLLAFGMLFYHFKFLEKIHAIRRKIVSPKQQEHFRNFYEKFEGWEIFFNDFKDTTWIQQGYLLFFIIRDILASVVLTTLFDHPLVQTILLTSINLCMLAYIIWKRPLKELIDNVQQVFNEAIILIVNFSVLILAGMEATNSSSTTVITGTGKTIITVSLIFNFSISVFLMAKWIIAIREACKTRKAKQTIISDTKDQNKCSLNQKQKVDPKDIEISNNAEIDSSLCRDLNSSINNSNPGIVNASPGKIYQTPKPTFLYHYSGGLKQSPQTLRSPASELSFSSNFSENSFFIKNSVKRVPQHSSLQIRGLNSSSLQLSANLQTVKNNLKSSKINFDSEADVSFERPQSLTNNKRVNRIYNYNK